MRRLLTILGVMLFLAGCATEGELAQLRSDFVTNVNATDGELKQAEAYYDTFFKNIDLANIAQKDQQTIASLSSTAPVLGEIRAFAFGGLKETDEQVAKLRQAGWMACEGQSVRVSDFKDLFTTIGFTWGADASKQWFGIPDLRGEFLRGWNHGAGTDPNISGPNGRKSKPGSGIKDGTDAVGTSQADQDVVSNPFQTSIMAPPVSHNPDAYGKNPANVDWIPLLNTPFNVNGPTPDLGGTGVETRPKNVYVMFCIYVGSPVPEGDFFAKQN